MAFTNISAAPELIEAFQSEGIRLIQVVVKDEVLTVKDKKEIVADNWEDDWKLIDQILDASDAKEPCYILFLLAKATDQVSASWLLIQYIPDNAHIRQKMLYASFKVPLVKELGGANLIADALQGNSRDDVTLKAYQEHKQQKDNPTKVLTESEQVASQVKKEELETRLQGTKKAGHTSQALSLGLTSKAEEALKSFSSFLALKVEGEEIDVLEDKDIKDFDQLLKAIPADTPAFCFFNYSSHTIFIYVCPPSAKIRDKMMYSATRGHVLQLAQDAGLKVEARYEVDEMSELEKDRIDADVNPGEASSSLAPKLAFK